MSTSIKEIREILEIFLDSELQDLRLEIGDIRLAVSKNGAALATQPFGPPPPRTVVAAADGGETAAGEPSGATATAAAPDEAPAAVPAGWVAVTAPTVGVFYRRPAPDLPPFVEEGGEVAENDPVCLIEVMKMFTGVAAPCRGRIARIVVEDAAVVEHGQVLMYVEPV